MLRSAVHTVRARAIDPAEHEPRESGDEVMAAVQPLEERDHKEPERGKPERVSATRREAIGGCEPRDEDDGKATRPGRPSATATLEGSVSVPRGRPPNLSAAIVTDADPDTDRICDGRAEALLAASERVETQRGGVRDRADWRGPRAGDRSALRPRRRCNWRARRGRDEGDEGRSPQRPRRGQRRAAGATLAANITARAATSVNITEPRGSQEECRADKPDGSAVSGKREARSPNASQSASATARNEAYSAADGNDAKERISTADVQRAVSGRRGSTTASHDGKPTQASGRGRTSRSRTASTRDELEDASERAIVADPSSDPEGQSRDEDEQQPGEPREQASLERIDGAETGSATAGQVRRSRAAVGLRKARCSAATRPGQRAPQARRLAGDRPRRQDSNPIRDASRDPERREPDDQCEQHALRRHNSEAEEQDGDSRRRSPVAFLSARQRAARQ